MPQFADRVKVTTTSTGASDIILSASGVTGYAAVPSGLDGETIGYVIESGSDFEIGTGTYTHSTRRLTRSIRSSSTGSALALSSTNSPHTVFLTPGYQDIQIVEAFSSTSDLPSASANHGRIYHVHGQGALYFAHAGNWVKVANYSDITSYTHPNHSGEVTSVADGAMTIADDVVDEANLKVSNTPTDGYVLTARSGNTGGMTWEAASSGGIASQYSSTIFTVGASSEYNTSSKVLTTNYTASKVAVFLNGVKLLVGIDFIATNGTTIDLTNAAPVTGDKIEVVEHGALAGGIGLTDLSVGSDASASGTGGIAYNNTSGVFTYTPVSYTHLTLPTKRIV